ncbi:MAG TPA: hypothetical protein VN228_08365 [Pyrinomonadaceae bacterium]|nr:hypothetical protein [Pyrinomonadaceae bacterium]
MSQNRPDNDNTTTGGAGGGTTGAGGTSAGATGDPSQWGARTSGGAGGTGAGTATGLAGDAGTSTGLSTSTTGGGGEGGGLTDTARQYGQKVAEYGQHAKDYLGERFSGVGDKITDLRNKDYGQMAEEAKDYARQNPGQALLVAAAAGFVLGLLLRGGRR